MRAKKRTLAALCVCTWAVTAACTKEMQEPAPVPVAGEEMCFTATRADAAPERKTLVHDGTSVWWSPCDSIKVCWGGFSEGKFVSSDTEASASATFTGVLTAAAGGLENASSGPDFWGIYPYATGSRCDGSSVTLTVPAEQAAVSGSFDPAAFPALARSQNLALAFWNVCGGLLFTVSRDDIRSVTFAGNAGEVIAGTVRVTMDEAGHPQVAEVLDGEDTVCLCAPGEETLLPGTSYYISLLPGALESGCSLTFRTLDAVATYTLSSAVTLRRSVFGVLRDKDANLDFLSPDRGEDLSLSGTANCYIVSAPGSYQFRATVKGHTETPLDGTPASADVLWESFGTDVTPTPGDLLRNVQYAGGYLSFCTPDTMQDGNAVVAVRDAEGTILWSWHLWFCEGFDATATAQSYYNNAGTLMDRNLGATSATPGDVHALGLLYQWGRKDPFLSGAGIASNRTKAASTLTWPEVQPASAGCGTMAYATAHPTTFITCEDNGGDWYDTGTSAPENTRWNAAKGVEDPCPAGWRVPDGGETGVWVAALGGRLEFDDVPWDGVNRGLACGAASVMPLGPAASIWYPATGYLSNADGGLYDAGYGSCYWSCTPSGPYAYYLYFDYWGDFYPVSDYGRARGRAVRCLSEDSPAIVMPAGVELDATELSLTVGQTAALSATVLPAAANVRTVTWSSSDDGVATVSDTGEVTAVAAGTCTITATSCNGITATCAVTVGEAQTPAADRKYLTFTALQNPVQLSLNNVGGNAPVLYYSYDGVQWTLWDYSALTFSPDAPLYLCGMNPDGFSHGSKSFSEFVATSYNSYEVSGDIMSLLDYTIDSQLQISAGCFYAAFYNCAYLQKAPSLPATTLAASCYEKMFFGCVNLTQAPELPATTLAEHCYDMMFRGCTGLIQAPALPATTLAEYCYMQMFYGCTGLTYAPTLPATTLAVYCYSSMFQNCTSLILAPELPATTLTTYCYHSMFSGCTGLTLTPPLTATTLAEGCYWAMFSGCAGLTRTSALPATTLAENCYREMFSSCTRLTQTPELPAMTLEPWCYDCMFSDCTGLIQAPALPATTLATMCYDRMFCGCTGLTQAPALLATTLADCCYYEMFSGCISLTQAPALPATTLTQYCYHGMFKGCTGLIQAPELPVMTLTEGCYRDMFSGCSSLMQAPVLPATHLELNCYKGMFSGCSSLTQAPALPAMTLEKYCYYGMFENCTSLIHAPELPGMTLAWGCYERMFCGCVSLTLAPALPATMLETRCYNEMFKNCINLHTVICYALNSWEIVGNATTMDWLSGVPATGTFVKHPDMDAWPSGASGIPDGWEVVNATSGMENGHEWVDLGLSVKWATCNVGADAPREYGDYFAWGETEPKEYYDWDTYKYCKGSSTTLTRYCDDSNYGYRGFTDNWKRLALDDDAARVNWGGNWRMPTITELDELRNQCTWERSVGGYLIKSKKNAESIFWPYAGSRYQNSLYEAGSVGIYGTSTYYTGHPDYQYYRFIYASSWYTRYYPRGTGVSIRPVMD
ncbi:MAG: Ig-like domain-containing protein [Bacteroidales bacterium]|nr:Ig-like domain-containing protein [Bacteroidales bacterium]